MKDFAQQFLDAVGVTLAAALASLFGAVAGLAFAKGVTPGQAVVIVLTGVGTGSFGSAGLISYWQLSPGVAAGLAFILAVVAMPLLGLAFAVVTRWRGKADNIADRAVDKVLPPGPNQPPPPNPMP